MSRITQQWLLDLGGIHGIAIAGGKYWDFPIVSKHCKYGETYLRVHESVNDGEWATDLFDRNGHSIGIVNWPTTRRNLLKLMDALGCVTNRSVRQVLIEDAIFADGTLENSRPWC